MDPNATNPPVDTDDEDLDDEDLDFEEGNEPEAGPEGGLEGGTGEPGGAGTQTPGPEPEPTEPPRLPPTKVLRQRLSAERKARKQYEDAVKRLARLAGTDVDTLLQQVDLAERIGFAPGQVATPQPQPQQPLPSQPTDPTATALLASGLAYQQALDARYAVEAAQLRQDPLYADIDAKLPVVKQTAQRYGLTLRQAYNMLYADETAKRAEQRALQSAQQRRGLTAERDLGVAEPAKLGLDDDEYDAAIRMGYDPRVYAALKKATNLDEYERLLEAAKRKR